MFIFYIYFLIKLRNSSSIKKLEIIKWFLLSEEDTIFTKL